MKCLMNHKIGFMSLLVVFCSFFLSILFGLSANAAGSINTGSYSYWYDNPGNYLKYQTTSNQAFAMAPSSGLDYFRYLLGEGTGYFYSFSVGDTIVTSGSLLIYFEYSESGGNDLLQFNCPQYRDSFITQVDCKIDRSNDISGGGHIGAISWVSTGVVNTDSRVDRLAFNSIINNTSVTHHQFIFPGGLTIAYGPDISSSGGDYSGVLNNISTRVTELYRSICGDSGDTVCYKLDVIAENLGNISSVAITDAIDELNVNQIATNEKLDTQIELQQEANEQQQEQYESEKEEEAEREAEQSDSADEMASLFSFTSFNPFSPLFELFGDGSGCVNIPTLSSWLHVSQTRVCPFFPASVRNVATPILGIASMMLIFGFFIHWLKGNDGNSGITIKGGF